MTTSIKGYVMIMMGLTGILLSILAVQQIYGGAWGAVANAVTGVIVIIAFLAIVIMSLLGR